MHNLADSLMSGANPIFDFIVVCLNFLSIFVIVWGVLIAGIDFVRYELTEKDRLVAARENNFIRNYLGSKPPITNLPRKRKASCHGFSLDSSV